MEKKTALEYAIEAYQLRERRIEIGSIIANNDKERERLQKESLKLYERGVYIDKRTKIYYTEDTYMEDKGECLGKIEVSTIEHGKAYFTVSIYGMVFEYEDFLHIVSKIMKEVDTLVEKDEHGRYCCPVKETI